MRSPPPCNKGKRIIKINAITQAHLIKLLLEGTYTCAELAEMTGLHYVTVLQYTRELYRAKAVHIADWGPDSRGQAKIKIYKIGRAKDAKRPRLSEGEKQARYRAKMQAIKTLQRMSGPILEPA